MPSTAIRAVTIANQPRVRARRAGGSSATGSVVSSRSAASTRPSRASTIDRRCANALGSSVGPCLGTLPLATSSTLSGNDRRDQIYSNVPAEASSPIANVSTVASGAPRTRVMTTFAIAGATNTPPNDNTVNPTPMKSSGSTGVLRSAIGAGRLTRSSTCCSRRARCSTVASSVCHERLQVLDPTTHALVRLRTPLQTYQRDFLTPALWRIRSDLATWRTHGLIG